MKNNLPLIEIWGSDDHCYYFLMSLINYWDKCDSPEFLNLIRAVEKWQDQPEKMLILFKLMGGSITRNNVYGNIEFVSSFDWDNSQVRSFVNFLHIERANRSIL